MNLYVKIGLAVLAVSIFAHFLLRSGADKGEDISVLVEDGALVIDTRTAGEFSSGHIEGAINIAYDSIGQVIGKYESDLARPIIVYCHSGARSSIAKKALQQAGYARVVNGGSLRHMRAVLQP